MRHFSLLRRVRLLIQRLKYCINRGLCMASASANDGIGKIWRDNMSSVISSKFTDCPQNIFVGTWMLAFSIYALVLGSFSLDAFLEFMVFSLFLVFGSKVSYLLWKPSKVSGVVFSSAFILILSYIVSALIFFDIIYVLKVIKYMLHSDSISEALYEIRQSTLDGNSVIKNISLYINVNQLTFGLCSFGYVALKEIRVKCETQGATKSNERKIIRKPYLLFIIGVLMSITISLLDGSRSFFLSGSITFLFILYQLSIINMRHIAIFFVSFAFLFSASFATFRPDSGSNNFSDGLKYSAVYFSGGVGSLAYALGGEPRIYWSDLEALKNKLQFIGFPIERRALESHKSDYFSIGDGYQTNVYTALGIYHKYMGYGSFVFAFFVGVFISYMSFKSRNSILGLYCYSFYLSAIVLSVFSDYFLSFSYFLVKILLILLLIWMLERWRNIKKANAN